LRARSNTNNSKAIKINSNFSLDCINLTIHVLFNPSLGWDQYYYDFIRIIVKIIVKPSPPISGERCTEGYGFDDLILYFAYKIV
jgi:hypothetical protein